MSLVFGDEFLSQCLHLNSQQRCSAGIRTWLSADQSSYSTLTESEFTFDPCLILSQAGLELGALLWWLRDLPRSHRSGNVGPKQKKLNAVFQEIKI